MKIKNLKINQKLLELYLIKLRTYEQYDKKVKDVTNVSISQTLINFKKTLRIIYKFHKKNKRILFLGFNGIIFKKINKETNHVALPSKIKLQGIIFNKLKLNEKISLLKLKTFPNLIVIFNEITNNNSILTESFKYKIPTITFGKNTNRNNNMFLYNIPANTEFLLNNKNLFYNCLKFLFKKKTELNRRTIKKK
jgi:ribosomal protein S2